MDTYPRMSGRLVWAAAMGAVVIAVIAAVGLIAQTRQTTSIEPAADGDNTEGVDGTEIVEPVGTTANTIGPEQIAAFEECMSTLTVTLTQPCVPGPYAETDADIQSTHSTEFESVPTTGGPDESHDDGQEPSAQTTLTRPPDTPPVTATSEVEGCNQVTTIPDCHTLTGSTETWPTTEPGPHPTGQCVFVEGSTTVPNRPECHTTTTGPVLSPTSAPEPTSTTAPGPGASAKVCDLALPSTTDPSCPG